MNGDVPGAKPSASAALIDQTVRRLAGAVGPRERGSAPFLDVDAQVPLVPGAKRRRVLRVEEDAPDAGDSFHRRLRSSQSNTRYPARRDKRSWRCTASQLASTPAATAAATGASREKTSEVRTAMTAATPMKAHVAATARLCDGAAAVGKSTPAMTATAAHPAATAVSAAEYQGSVHNKPGCSRAPQRCSTWCMISMSRMTPALMQANSSGRTSSQRKYRTDGLALAPACAVPEGLRWRLRAIEAGPHGFAGSLAASSCDGHAEGGSRDASACCRGSSLTGASPATRHSPSASCRQQAM